MRNIAIYGAGAFGKIFFDCLENVDCFIDDFSNKSEINNTPIKPLKEIQKDTKIFISILQHSKKIEKELIEKGYTDIVNFTNSVLLMPNILKEVSKINYLWLVEDINSMTNDNQLEKLNSLLKDNKSKEILSSMIMLRKTLDIKYYIKPFDVEYFPSDIPILKNLNTVNFIDCGAYIGDTIKELTKQTKNIGYTLSFEPDAKNLDNLNIELKKLHKKYNLSNFLVYPAGVYSSNNILKFSNNGIGSSASFDDNSILEIPVVALDSIILNSNPNFIKMDIEGAEKEALLGAKKTIQKYKPNLAICLYHKPEDLWELPLLIHDIEPSYEMYIRVHEDMCLSTVLYCISKE